MEIVFADKPAGATTHTSLNDKEKRRALTDLNDGFAEMLSDRMGEKLFVVHRLDRDTTGAICFARNSDSAEILRGLFESRAVKKRYLFLTDRSSKKAEFTIESHIAREGNEFVSRTDLSVNARTNFKLLESSDGLHLWEARPETGRPHQIRLHAESSGISILGDAAHGGSDFPALCLHSESISFEHEGKTHRYSSAAPRYFNDRSLAALPLSHWITAIDRRERLQRSGCLPKEETLRLVHSEGNPLRLEVLGEVLSLNWFRETVPSENEWAALRTLCEMLGFKKWYLQIRGNRGRTPSEETIFFGPVPLPERWTAIESGLNYEFRTDNGLSPGLFLDQRQNRKWVREFSQGKSVLNLFSYTCGFSVAAAAGGAKKVVSIDVSRPFLNWGERNFELNDLSLEGHEFRSMDSREYLAWAKKKGLKFDLVICDPPSFSRSKSGLFKIEKDFKSLLEALIAVLSPSGRVLFSSNFEGWTIEQMELQALEVVKKNSRLRLERTPSADWDFELPRQLKNMKSFFVVSI